jgi:hypothetical protein
MRCEQGVLPALKEPAIPDRRSGARTNLPGEPRDAALCCREWPEMLYVIHV